MVQIKETLTRLLADEPGLEVAYLFGSHARGTARPDSDVDVAVRYQRPMTAAQKPELMEAIATELGCAVDLADFTTYLNPSPARRCREYVCSARMKRMPAC